MNAKPLATEFPNPGAWRARLANGELSDAFAQSYGLAAAHGRDVRRAYRLAPDGRVEDMSWRTLQRIADAEERCDAAEAKAGAWDRLATRAREIADGPNGAELRASDLANARHIGDVFRGLANGLADGNAAGASASLAGLAHGAYRLAGDALAIRRTNATLTANLAQADKAAGERNAAVTQAAALSLADRTQLRGSPFPAARCAARYLESFANGRDVADLAGAFDAFRELERQACEKAGEARDATAALHSLQSVNAANAEARAKAERESAAYREQRDSEGARAAKAERQLAEYRSLMRELPAGLALRHPGALALLRAYLADVESDG